MYLTCGSLWCLRKAPFIRSVLLHTRTQGTFNHRHQKNRICTWISSSFLVNNFRSSRLRAARGVEAHGTAVWDSGMDEYLRVALLAAKKAGAVIKESFHKEKLVEHKGTVDLVTETDKKCEEIVFSSIQDAFPDHKFIGEEGSAAQGFTAELTDAPTWMVDPVDGTTNFVHRFPFVCVCIGLAIKKQVVVGVVYNPILDELYTAVRGKGAYLNGEPIHVSDCKDLGSALIITEIGVTRDDVTLGALFGRISGLVKGARSVRCMGSCALDICFVASGRAEVSYEVGFGGPWDVAAASLIVEEAGGHVADPAGGPFDIMGRRVLATSNTGLAQQVGAIIAPLPLGPKEPQAS